MTVRDDELDPAQAASRRDCAGSRSRTVSASLAPVAMPSTSRRPSVLTATAMVAATETMRPAWRTLT